MPIAAPGPTKKPFIIVIVTLEDDDGKNRYTARMRIGAAPINWHG
jgi:hypothetical protein